MKKLLILLLFTCGILQAGIFDDRYPSARALAMGDAYVAMNGDLWSAYYNPAALSSLKDYQVGAAYQRPYNLSFFRNYFVSIAGQLPQKFGGLSLTVQDFGVNYMDNDLSTEYTAALSHGIYLLNDIHSSLSFGYSLKYYFWDLGESVGGLDLGAGHSFGVDVGLQASLYNRTYIGVYLLNINAPTIGAFTSHDLPQRIVVGAAYRPQNGVITSIALNKTSGLDTQVEAGFEFQVVEFLALRLGAGTNPNRLSGGIGINYQGINFDYALRTHPVLAETHLFGLSYTFNANIFK